MVKKSLLFVGSLVLYLLFFGACGDSSTGPGSRLEFVEFSTANPISLLDFLGMDLNDLESYFLVDWTLNIDFDNRTKSPFRRSFARGWAPIQGETGLQPRGLDLGTVSFGFGIGDSTQFSFDLSRTFSPAVGFVYRSFDTPSPGVARFVPGDSLQFKRSGTGDIDSLTIGLTAPSDSICFTGPSTADTLDSSQELRVTWRGGASTDRILLTMQPVIEFSNGRGFLSGIYDFFENNTSEFVLSTQELLAFLDQAAEELTLQANPEATLSGVFVYAALPVIQEVIVGNRKAVALAFSSDQLFLPLQ